MYPLFIISCWAIFLISKKTTQLLSIHIHHKKTNTLEKIQTHLQSETPPNLNASFPIDNLLQQGISIVKSKPTRQQLEDHLKSIYESEMYKLEKNMRIILVLGEIAPMLGILGTISGMIHVFKSLNFHSPNQTQLLTEGISQALITTQTGLFLSIPILLIYAILHHHIYNLEEKMRHVAYSLIQFAHKHNHV